MKRPYHYFAIFDFDGTAGLTFKRSSAGVGVNEAYRSACGDIFGFPLGEELYDRVGGIKNRTPGELIRAILNEGDSECLLVHARACLDREASRLESYVPACKKLSLVWNGERPDLSVTELCVRLKLRILMAQIGGPCGDGTEWPNPAPGFEDAWRLLQETYVPGVRIVPAIISSGHDYFIDECFRMWGLLPPKLKITDDTMRSFRSENIPECERAKPHTGPFRMLFEEWLRLEGEDPALDAAEIVGDRGFYAGDSLVADGGLAENTGLSFLWFNPEGRTAPGLKVKVMQVEHWTRLTNLLLSRKVLQLMGKGASFAHIIDAAATMNAGVS